MKRLAALIVLFFAFGSLASAAPVSLILTPERAEVAFTLKPFEISVGDNFAGTINMQTGHKSFVHDLALGGKLYLPARGQLDSYFFGSIGYQQLVGRTEEQNFRVGFGSQYNLADNFALFGEFGADVTRAGKELELTTASNSFGLRFNI